MKSENILEESKNYLISIANGLYNLYTTYKIDKQDRILLEQYTKDLMVISTKLETMRTNLLYKKELEKKMREETSKEK